jgi:hypothetical protein
MDGQTDRQADRWANRRSDSRTDEWMDRQAAERIDGQTFFQKMKLSQAQLLSR